MTELAYGAFAPQGDDSAATGGERSVESTQKRRVA
jgi:hypothetical protein